MKNSTKTGFDPHYNVQAVVDQESLLIVAPSLSNHPNGKQKAAPAPDAIAAEAGQPMAFALDNGLLQRNQYPGAGSTQH